MSKIVLIVGGLFLGIICISMLSLLFDFMIDYIVSLLEKLYERMAKNK